MKFNRIAAFALLLSLVVALPCFAGVSPEEAAKLKTTLTPMGAERAGNKEGTIPAWTGEVTPMPPGKFSQWPPDLFPNDKPLFSISAKNMDQYADKLTDGVKAWMKRHPEWRLDVYPTRRTAVYPDYIYEGTFKNATRAKLSADGFTISNSLNGTPFPIPKSGIELMWNKKLTYSGSAGQMCNRSYIVPNGGKPLLVGERYSVAEYPMNYKGISYEKFRDLWEENITAVDVEMLKPPASAGERVLSTDTLNYSKGDKVNYSYVVGQRRVRRSPSLNYDTPNPTNSGYGNNDESGMFYGRPDRFNWKLIGKKEMYIPYNNNKIYDGGKNKDLDVITGPFLNPDKVRWELHRVWILEATLVPGKRHVSPRRVIYMDEDTWFGSAAELYDANGKLWKIGLGYPLFEPRVPYMAQGPETWFNMQTGGILVDSFTSTESGRPVRILNGGSINPPGFYTPDALAARGLR